MVVPLAFDLAGEEAEIGSAFERFEVVELVVDPPGWAAEIDRWVETYGDRVVEFPTASRQRMAPACDRFRTAVMEGELVHDGDPVLARHVGYAVAKLTPLGTTITKAHPDSPRKIDAAVAAVIAHERAAWHRGNPPAEPMIMWARV